VSIRRRAIVGMLAATAIAASGCGALGSVQVFTVGECVDALVPDGEEVTDLPVVDCTGEHLGEVVGTLDVAEADTWPGQAAHEEQADSGCAPAFATYVGRSYEESRLEMSYLYPTESSWAAGDRQIVCIVFEPEGARRTGTVKGIAE
jgi:putative regulator of septum formation